MTIHDYLDMLAEVQRSTYDLKTQVTFLESMVKHLPIGQQRGIRAYFADIHHGLEEARDLLFEMEDWCMTYCPPQMAENEDSTQLELFDWLPGRKMPGDVVEGEIPGFCSVPEGE